MLSVFVFSHSSFADGISNAAKMICGNQENLYSLGFNESEDMMEFSQKIKEMVELELNRGSEVVVFVDIPNATPFNSTIIALQEYQNCHLISGMNLPALMELLIRRDIENDYKKLCEEVVENARQALTYMTISDFINK